MAIKREEPHGDFKDYRDVRTLNLTGQLQLSCHYTIAVFKNYGFLLQFCTGSADSRRNGLSAGSLVNERSLCPWEHDGTDDNVDRYPQKIAQVKCLCRKYVS